MDGKSCSLIGDCAKSSFEFETFILLRLNKIKKFRPKKNFKRLKILSYKTKHIYIYIYMCCVCDKKKEIIIFCSEIRLFLEEVS